MGDGVRIRRIGKKRMYLIVSPSDARGADGRLNDGGNRW